MIFFYGLKARLLKTFSVNIPCKNCGQEAHFLHVFQNYFHLFWVPIFPIGKAAAFSCQNCLKVTEKINFDSEKKQMAQTYQSQAKTPFYAFSGLVLIVLALTYGFYENKKEEANTKAYLESPSENDLSVLQIKAEEFVIIKILDRSPAGIKFLVSNYVYGKQSGAKSAIEENRMKESDYFHHEIYEMTLEKYKDSRVKYIHRGH